MGLEPLREVRQLSWLSSVSRLVLGQVVPAGDLGDQIGSQKPVVRNAELNHPQGFVNWNESQQGDEVPGSVQEPDDRKDLNTLPAHQNQDDKDHEGCQFVNCTLPVSIF